jgi:hypothetical protein
LTVLGNLLGDGEVTVTAGRLKELQQKVASAQKRLKVPDSQWQTFEAQIRAYWSDKTPLPEDVALSMLLVMMHRYDVRRGRSGPSLFENEEGADADSSVVVAANDSVLEAALFHLFQQFDRPYFFGIDDLCDASSENAELFLQLAAKLVETVATQVVRAKPPTLAPGLQHKLLRERGASIIKDWSFPNVETVRRLAQTIAERCLQKSLQPNGAVIANAYGIPQSEFERLAEMNVELARVLQFAIAYNAITLVPHHSCKHKEWCLLELGGMELLKFGLTLKRGGFIEGNVAQLADFVKESNP